MSDKLLAASNAVSTKKQSIIELVDDNISLNRKNRLLWAGLIGLSAFSVFLFNSDRKNANALAGARSENKELAARVAYFQKDAANMALENKELKSYAEDAQSFALGIRPWLDENDSGCEDPNCAKCKQMEKENDKKLDEFSKAMDTIGIDEKMLSRLQEGWSRE